MSTFGRVFVRSRLNVAGSAIGGWESCWLEGIIMNHKKLLRLYREENLRMRRRRGRKRAMGARAPMTLPQEPNQRWSLDFVSDTLVCSRRIRILAVVDDFMPRRLQPRAAA